MSVDVNIHFFSLQTFLRGANPTVHFTSLEMLSTKRRLATAFAGLEVLETPRQTNPYSWSLFQAGVEMPLVFEGLYDGSTIQPGNLEPHSL